jgi:hypothetical protein
LAGRGYGSDQSAERSQTALLIEVLRSSLHFGLYFFEFLLHPAQAFGQQAQAVIEIGFLTIIASPRFVFPE